jgi:rare lipoprotein A (peptidoglycan hydrolase)
VRPTLALRAAVLAAIAFLGALIGIGILHSRDGHATALPKAAGWYTAKAASYQATASHRRTACGQLLTSTTIGVAHPVLPCGVKIYIAYRGRQVLTQVIDRGPSVPGREFDLTKPLADKIGLHGTQTIRWGFAR